MPRADDPATLALTNFHDDAMRYKTRWDPKAYHKPMFRPARGFSPDFTKVVFFSAMLTGDDPDRKWADVYVAVSRYPEPPVDLRKDGAALVWDKPRRRAEIQGYTTGWPLTGEAARGAFSLRIVGKQAGFIPVEGFPARWVALDADAVPLAAGVVELEVATRDAGIAIDNLPVTNDPSFVPRGRGQVPEELAAVPQGLCAVPFAPEDERAFSASPKDQRPRVKLAWNPVSAQQGVSHYNVYRSDAEAFEAEPCSISESFSCYCSLGVVSAGKSPRANWMPASRYCRNSGLE